MNQKKLPFKETFEKSDKYLVYADITYARWYHKKDDDPNSLGFGSTEIERRNETIVLGVIDNEYDIELLADSIDKSDVIKYHWTIESARLYANKVKHYTLVR